MASISLKEFFSIPRGAPNPTPGVQAPPRPSASSLGSLWVHLGVLVRSKFQQAPFKTAHSRPSRISSNAICPLVPTPTEPMAAISLHPRVETRSGAAVSSEDPVRKSNNKSTMYTIPKIVWCPKAPVSHHQSSHCYHEGSRTHWVQHIFRCNILPNLYSKSMLIR